MIELCRRQLNFADGLIVEEVTDLWEDWMRHVDEAAAAGWEDEGLENFWTAAVCSNRCG